MDYLSLVYERVPVTNHKRRGNKLSELSSKAKIAYLIPEYPAQTHIFFWREISAMKLLGQEIDVFSTKPADLSKVKHSFAREQKELCFYTFPPTLGAFVELVKSPLWFLKALLYAFKVEGGFKDKLKTMALIPSTAQMKTNLNAVKYLMFMGIHVQILLICFRCYLSIQDLATALHFTVD